MNQYLTTGSMPYKKHLIQSKIFFKSLDLKAVIERGRDNIRLGGTTLCVDTCCIRTGDTAKSTQSGVPQLDDARSLWLTADFRLNN